MVEVEKAGPSFVLEIDFMRHIEIITYKNIWGKSVMSSNLDIFQ